MSTDSETSTYDYSSDEEAHNYNIDDPFYRGLTLPESMVLEPRPPSRGKIFYSLRTPRSVFANMSPEQQLAWENISLSRGMRIRVDPE